MEILFRVDSSKEIGFGHLHRCLNLANHLKKNASITFISRNFKNSNLALIKKNKFKLIILKKKLRVANQKKDALETINNINKKYDLLIVDHYALGYKWEKSLSNFTKKLMVIDDYLTKKHFCNIILNYNFAVKKISYKNYFLKKTKFLLGSKYAIINSKYNKVKKIKKELNKIFIFLGTDNRYTTKNILNILKKKKLFKNKFEIVLTKGVRGFQSQIDFVKKLKNCNVYFGLPNLIKVIQKTQIGIVSGGQIVFECLKMGLPLIVFQTAKNQEMSCKFLKKKKMINFMGVFNKKKTNVFLNTFKELTTNKKLRYNKTKKIKDIIDGKGVERVSRYLINSIKK
jgi:UDP-2,4-diacetamido-2,4,6-trideoxy-beta-L-altropyranose hydrolase